jgi:hypothetical protein
MKLSTTVALAIMLAASSAFAGAGAPVPETPEGGPPSGRPGPVLDDDKCDAVWELITAGADDDDSVAVDKASPYIVNLEMVDTNKDKQVSDDEFEDGCEKGWVQEKPSKPADATGGGQTPAAPEKPQP